jgi:hypothetical protein
MPPFFIALTIGIAAGLIDVIPMIIQKLDKSACWSAFVHWVVLGTIIPFVDWDIQPWLKGLIIGELVSLPVMILVFATDKKAIIPISIFSAILGTGCAVAGSLLIK